MRHSDIEIRANRHYYSCMARAWALLTLCSLLLVACRQSEPAGSKPATEEVGSEVSDSGGNASASAEQTTLAWEYGPVVLSSEDLDFQPVDVEAIALTDGTIRLWVDGIGEQEIRTFTSADGLEFVEDEVEPISGQFPSVVALADGGYRMYVTRVFDGFDPDVHVTNRTRVFSLYSDDGLSWVEEPGERAIGYESSAVVLEDGRTLMAVRRDSAEIPDPIWCNSPEASAIWFLVSEDGLTFSDVGEFVDGVKNPELEGRAFGVEFGRLPDGQLVVHYEGCLPAFFASVNESSLTTGIPEVSALRGQAVYDEYGFAENIGGAGGDITLLTVNGELKAFISLRDGADSMMSSPGNDGVDVRQRIALVTLRSGG
jgi:hypothetical protein